MKRMFYITLALMLTTSAFAKHSWPMESWPIQRWPLNLVEQNNCEEILSNDDDWILIGEVLLKECTDSGKLKANLYIREVAHKIIYRIEYNGKFYAVKKDRPEDDNSNVYDVTIDNKCWWFCVQ